MNRFCLISLLIVISGCAPISVTSSHNSTVDFSNLKTYAWGRNILKIDEDGRIINKHSDKVESMANRNIQPITDSIFSNKGFKLAESNPPDFIVSYVAHGRVQSTLPRDARMVTYENNKQIKLGSFLMGSLAFTIRDGEQKKIIWRGMAETPVTGSGEDSDRLKKVIMKILKDFP